MLSILVTACEIRDSNLDMLDAGGVGADGMKSDDVADGIGLKKALDVDAFCADSAGQVYTQTSI